MYGRISMNPIWTLSSLRYWSRHRLELSPIVFKNTSLLLMKHWPWAAIVLSLLSFFNGLESVCHFALCVYIETLKLCIPFLSGTVEMKKGQDFDWDDEMASSRPHDPVPVLATDPLYIIYTSGTTGLPKVYILFLELNKWIHFHFQGYCTSKWWPCRVSTMVDANHLWNAIGRLLVGSIRSWLGMMSDVFHVCVS